MANITKMLTYNIPDELYSTANTLGKTSTQLYNGPEEIVLWVDKETGYVKETFHPDEEPDRPLPLDVRREILKADTDENCIKIGLLWGGLEKPKIYEVAVGPADQPNAVITDPSDVRMVFNQVDLPANYTAPLEFMEYKRDRSWDFYKTVRNSLLSQSDGKIASDMPEELKQKWITYRQKLRDMPTDWAGVPEHLVRFPLSPDQTVDMNFDDPEVDVIRIADRTEADNDALAQLPNGAN
jgi:hypothetical protein